MRRIIVAVVCIFPFAAFAQNKYTINGEIRNPEDIEKVKLIYHTLSGLGNDSANVVAGKFKLSASMSSITDGTISLWKGDRIIGQRSIYLEPKEFTITSPTASLKDAIISGSPVNDENRILQEALKPVTEKTDSLMKKWRTTPDKERMDSVFRRKFAEEQRDVELQARAIKKEFALAHLDSYVALLAYFQTGIMNFENDFDGYVKEFMRFSPQVRATDVGRGVQERIDGFLKTRVGSKAMDFSQKDVNGKSVKLSDFRGKYVLLDFWASWCMPCRAENPVLLKAYQAYKNKNFNILSVSLDKAEAKEAWLKAIQKDGMVWTNVTDLKYWRNEAAVQYGVKSVPANFLIDPSGNIVAKDLRGEELEKKLAELLN